MLLALALGCGLVASIGISQVMDRPARPRWKRRRSTSPCTTSTWATRSTPRCCRCKSGRRTKSRAARSPNWKSWKAAGRARAIIEGEPILEGKLLAPGQVADPIQHDSEGHAAEDDRRRRGKERGGCWAPATASTCSCSCARMQRTGIETAKSKVILQNIRVFAVDQTVQRSPDGGEEKADRQDRFADAHAGAGEQAVAGRANLANSA